MLVSRRAWGKKVNELVMGRLLYGQMQVKKKRGVVKKNEKEGKGKGRDVSEGKSRRAKQYVKRVSFGTQGGNVRKRRESIRGCSALDGGQKKGQEIGQRHKE